MKWLLDTNVIAEPGKKRPDSKVMKWLDAIDENECALSVLTLGEIEKGIHSLPAGSSRGRHEAGLNALKIRFAGRIFEVTVAVAAKWGALLGEAERKGKALPAVDNLIAATAVFHSLILVTRNTRDISPAVSVFNPFA